MNETKLGQLLGPDDGQRDAIHIAVQPVEAAEDMLPGWHAAVQGYNKDTRDYLVGRVLGGEAVGIIDPFLSYPVHKGQRCYLCLLPGAVTSLRHVWTHPAFTTTVNVKSLIEKLQKSVGE